VVVSEFLQGTNPREEKEKLQVIIQILVQEALLEEER